jgi:hypothetical protein
MKRPTILILFFLLHYTVRAQQICYELLLNSKFTSDALVATQAPNANYGSHPDLEAATWTCQGSLCLGRSLIKFDLNIPSTATIDSAFLMLYANLNAPNGITNQPTYGIDNGALFRRITQDWDEYTVTWNNQPATTTQDEVMLPPSTTTAQDYKIDFKTLLQYSVQNPTTAYGYMIQEQNEILYYNSLIFASSDNADQSILPKIKICYSVNTTGVNESAIPRLNLFPNPFHDEIHFSGGDENIRSVSLLNVLGESLMTINEPQKEGVIQASQLPDGIYFIRTFSESGNGVQMVLKR